MAHFSGASTTKNNYRKHPSIVEIKHAESSVGVKILLAADSYSARVQRLHAQISPKTLQKSPEFEYF